MLYGGLRFMHQNIFPVDDTARFAARDAQQEARALRERLDRMALLFMAVWSLAAEKLEISNDQLEERVQELDLSDGKLDGKLSPSIGECPHCQRQLSKRHCRCIYCGYTRPPDLAG
jgi:hypothetical protein